jgi:hypothetical protein
MNKFSQGGDVLPEMSGDDQLNLHRTNEDWETFFPGARSSIGNYELYLHVIPTPPHLEEDSVVCSLTSRNSGSRALDAPSTILHSKKKPPCNQHEGNHNQ